MKAQLKPGIGDGGAVSRGGRWEMEDGRWKMEEEVNGTEPDRLGERRKKRFSLGPRWEGGTLLRAFCFCRISSRNFDFGLERRKGGGLARLGVDVDYVAVSPPPVASSDSLPVSLSPSSLSPLALPPLRPSPAEAAPARSQSATVSSGWNRARRPLSLPTLFLLFLFLVEKRINHVHGSFQKGKNIGTPSDL